MDRAVAGTPRWAVVAAYGAIASVVPSALWRTAVGLGVPLGWRQQQLDRLQIPGWGTLYVLGLSAASIAAASLTLGLVRRWGEVLPHRLPLVGGKTVPPALAVAIAATGAFAVIAICILSVLNWHSVSGFADRPRSGWAMLMVACYLPALLWGPLVLAATWAYRRRRRTPRR